MWVLPFRVCVFLFSFSICDIFFSLVCLQKANKIFYGSTYKIRAKLRKYNSVNAACCEIRQCVLNLYCIYNFYFFNVLDDVFFNVGYVQCICANKYQHKILRSEYRTIVWVLRVFLECRRLHRGTHQLFCIELSFILSVILSMRILYFTTKQNLIIRLIHLK